MSERGALAEEAAADFLTGRGLRLLATNEIWSGLIWNL